MKKKIMFITTAAIIIALAIAGTAFAGNGNESGETLEKTGGTGYGRSVERETGQRFAVQADQYETEEAFHAAVLVEKLAILETKVEDGDLTRDDADAMIEYLTSCDGTCETEGENPGRPVDGWGIFGNSGQDGQGSRQVNSKGMGQGVKGSDNRGTGVNAADCDEDGEPILDGSGSENGQGYRGGNNN